MHIKFVEIQNFRKLKSIRIELTSETTVFVGANNSGKTSAMDALSHFLVDKRSFSTNDFTLTNWKNINKIGTDWENQSTDDDTQKSKLDEWEGVLPTMDVWLHVEKNEIHYVSHLIPTLDWDGGLLGVRLRFEPKDIEYLYKDYLLARKSAKETTEIAKQKSDKITIELWPSTMREFLDRKLSNFVVRAYILDPSKCTKPVNGIAIPQTLPLNSDFLDGDPFQGLIRIDDINAQRGLSDVGKKGLSDGEVQQQGEKRKLSTQLRDYYAKHLDPSDFQEPSDLDALQAIDSAQTSFNERLRNSFSNALSELEALGYPGFTDPRLTISTKIQPIDGLNHETAVQFEIIDQSGTTHKKPLRLPEQYNGLGYQNLIFMVFKLMSFRDAWMKVGKAAKRILSETTEYMLPPLHLVLVEEPEAHLHAQVQQVFIRKAHSILRNHDDLGDKSNLTTQLVISTHSSHIAHETKFSCLRYFRRIPAQKGGIDIPTTCVVNLSEVFDEKDNTQQFVTRYLKTTHCDLFFADAAILVEGPAERMLVPHFIRQNFEKLNQSYLTILEIGGSHAHRLKPLIEHLGLITLVITDLDSSEPTGLHPPKQPTRGAGLITRNSTLKTWVPEIKEVDTLLDLPESKKIRKYNDLFSVYAAYQCPIKVIISKEKEEALAYTFEDALVFENIDIFRSFSGFGLGKKFKTAIEKNDSSSKLGEAMFEALKSGNKAEFALDILDLDNLDSLQTPKYISDGLKWLQKQIQRKQEEILVLSKKPKEKE